MKQGVRVLFLLRAEQSQPSAQLLLATDSIHLLPAGSIIDSAARDFRPEVIAITAPFDHDAHVALEAVDELNLPALGIGEGNGDGLSVQVSDTISSADLRSILELLAAQVHERQTTNFICHAENAGRCLGRLADDSVRLLEHVLNVRFPDHPDRADRVADACLWIGSHLCLPPAELKDLLRAARLREIGKLGLPDSIVFAPRNKRTAEEQAAYDRYPELGARILSELASFRSTSRIVQYQLENFDGSGPAGLMAHQIPLGSRILRVAAAFTGIVTSREHWEGAAQEALAVLEQGRGAQFDPLLVKLVTNFHQTHKESAPAHATRLVRVADLAEGMIIAEDIWSRTGMKILPEGTRITPHILQLIRQFPLDPALEAVRVAK